MNSFALLKLAFLLASSFQPRGTFAGVSSEQHTRSKNPFSLQRQPLTRAQIQGMSKMTQHLKRLDEGIDENTSDYYLGYQPADQNTGWARYFNDTPVSFSQEFMSGLEVSSFIHVRS